MACPYTLMLPLQRVPNLSPSLSRAWPRKPEHDLTY